MDLKMPLALTVPGNLLVSFVLSDSLLVPFPQAVDTELQIVAIDHQHIFTFQVMKITGDKYRECRFANAALLIGNGYEFCL
jgi:hypothetical protein